MRKSVNKSNSQGGNGNLISPNVPISTAKPPNLPIPIAKSNEENLQIEGSERDVAIQMMGELTNIQVQHSLLCEKWASLEADFRTKQAALIKQIEDKKKEQTTWLKRIAKAHGIDVDEPNTAWQLDTNSWRFRRVQ